MDVHEMFMARRTTEILQLFSMEIDSAKMFWEHTLNEAVADILYVIVEDCSHDIHDLDGWDSLETLYTILCLFYQQTVKSIGKKQISTNLMYYHRYAKPFKDIDIKKIQKNLCTVVTDGKVDPLIFKILVLYMVLYSDIPSIFENLEALQELINSHFVEEKELTLVHIQLMIFYMDSLLLHQIESPLGKAQVERVTKLFLNNVNVWFTWQGRKECQSFTVLLPKVLKVTNTNEILRKTWEMLFTQQDDPGETLSILCLTADVWFSIESDYNKQLIDQALEEPFWLLLLKGLSSPLPQQRKQALYLIKRVVDFIDKHKTEGLELGNYTDIRPLVCAGNDSKQDSFKKNLNDFFLILEALEEKQKHLVQPVFPLLKKLLKETFEQENCETGCHIAWVRCAFLRILQHDNNAIIKWGLLNVLTLDLELYNDEFLDKVLDVLNNTYLYENDTNEGEPTVVEELTMFLNYAETKNTDLVTRFMVKASKITWGPVALFYVIHALSMVKKVESIWKEVELEAVKSLAEINLTMHCRILRIGAQIELLEALIHFATESLDLVVVANTLSAFSTSEALIRGQLSWKRITAWLSKIVKEEEATSFIERICGQMTSENASSDLSVRSFSLIIMLFYDGHLVLNSKLCPGLTALRNLLHCLIEAAARPSANTELRNKSIQLIGNLLEFASSKDLILCELISDYVDPTLKFIFKKLRNIFDETNIDDINTYGSVTQQLFTTENSTIQRTEVLGHIERFQIETCNIIEDGEYTNSVQRFFGIQILYACLKATNKKLINYKFIGPLYNTYKTLMTQSVGKKKGVTETCNEKPNLTGKIAAEYYKFVAELFYEYLKDEPADEWISDIDWIEQVSYLIQVGGKEIFVPSIGILSQIFYKGTVAATNIENFKSVLRLCWKSTLELNECRSAVEEIIKLIFSSPFLVCKETRELTIECTYEMMDKGDKIPGLSIVLLEGLYQAKEEYLSYFYEAVLVCLLHGTVPRRDQKIELQARSYVIDCYEKVYPSYLSNMNVNTNAATRAHAVTLLHKMITDDSTHAEKLLPLVVAKLDESHNKRYFGDSQIHRQKNRLMQVLLVLQPVLKEDHIESLHSLIRCNMLAESSQPSVRLMQEWLLIRIYLESDNLRSQIWDLFDQGQEKRVGSLCSVVSVVYHVAQLLSLDLQLEFINLAFQYITPCCMAQQFNVRLYAQVIAFKLYDLATKISYSIVTERYRELYIALTKSLKHGNLMKNSIKLQDDFYFTIFNPIDDYSLQTLFHELPRLSNVSMDECISLQMFEKFGFKQSNSNPLKLLNLNTGMSEAQVSAHILKSLGSAGPVADEIDNNVDYSTDMQKKFIPWKTMMPNEEELSEVSETLASRRKALTEGNNIILIASLIEKLPNLGGLSRTCEILGVKEFVVSSIKQTEDKEFQSLSVSAEKLIPLVEVKPHQLQDYLLEKKNTGYRLIGAEQTVNSTNLMDMKFEKKTVLLLGNEKAGIPANLIPLLDECVEIPQVGVVRSLNVHVTGAMCLWEYFKQHHSS